MYGFKIKAARKTAGLTQAQLAEKCGMATITIQQYERGVRDPRQQQLHILSAALGVPDSYFFEGSSLETQKEIDRFGSLLSKCDIKIQQQSTEGTDVTSFVEMRKIIAEELDKAMTRSAAELEVANISARAKAIEKEEADQQREREALLAEFARLDPKGRKEAIKRVHELVLLYEYKRQTLE